MQKKMFQTGQVTTKGLTVCLVRQLWFYYCFGTSFWKTDWHGITIIYVYVCSLQTAHRLFFKKFFVVVWKRASYKYLISHIEDMIQDCLFFLGNKKKGEKFQHKIVFIRMDISEAHQILTMYSRVSTICKILDYQKAVQTT